MRQDVADALQSVYQESAGNLWVMQQETICRCTKHLPEEVLQTFAFTEFVERYSRFRWVLQQVA